MEVDTNRSHKPIFGELLTDVIYDNLQVELDVNEYHEDKVRP